jgi:ferredoxin--NADP+ reductase
VPYSEQTVTSIRKWSDKTFSLTTTRPADFTFNNGEFVTIGLRPEGKMIARAYSIVSTNDSDYLEFLSIHVPDGPLTSQLAKVNAGDSVWINSKTTGTLTLKHIQPGRNLYLISTGTGLAPFISLINDPELYQTFDKVVLVHSVRKVTELAYRNEIESLNNPQLYYVPTVTRENFVTTARGADLFRSGKLFNQLGLPQADPQQDRVMLCGNPDMNKEMTDYLQQQGWTQTNYRGVGNFTTEIAFVISKSDDDD